MMRQVAFYIVVKEAVANTECFVVKATVCYELRMCL